MWDPAPEPHPYMLDSRVATIVSFDSQLVIFTQMGLRSVRPGSQVCHSCLLGFGTSGFVFGNRGRSLLLFVNVGRELCVGSFGTCSWIFFCRDFQSITFNWLKFAILLTFKRIILFCKVSRLQSPLWLTWCWWPSCRRLLFVKRCWS